MSHHAVPYDNNASERSVRPVKTKLKVNGQFRSDDGAKNYATLMSIALTARKNGKNPFFAFQKFTIQSVTKHISSLIALAMRYPMGIGLNSYGLFLHKYFPLLDVNALCGIGDSSATQIVDVRGGIGSVNRMDNCVVTVHAGYREAEAGVMG